MSDDMTRKPTQEDLHRLWDPIVKQLLKTYGKKETQRRFAQAAVECGFDPNELRIIFAEDLS